MTAMIVSMIAKATLAVILEVIIPVIAIREIVKHYKEA